MNYASPITLAMVKVAKEKRYAPDILAHELGHSSLHGDSRLLMPMRSMAPLAGTVVNVLSKKPYGLAGHLVPLADEAYASSKAMKTLKEWDVSEEDRKSARKRLGLGLASYAVAPVIDAGMTIGAVATGSPGAIAAAPIVARLAEAGVSPRLIKSMDKIPIEGISKERAVELAKKSRPGVEVHFSKRRLPARGMFVSKPLFREDVESSPRHDELGAFIGRKASGRLLREGGIVLGPTD